VCVVLKHSCGALADPNRCSALKSGVENDVLERSSEGRSTNHAGGDATTL
jgi:hypothetical protein